MDNKKAINEFQYQVCQTILNEGATYSSVILTRSGQVVSSYSTSQKWENIYHGAGLSDRCHLMQASRTLSQKNGNFIIIWDLLHPNNEISTYLNKKRKEEKICHGISFCKKNANDVLEILTLAGKDSDVHFSSQVIKNIKKIKKHMLGYKIKYINK